MTKFYFKIFTRFGCSEQALDQDCHDVLEAVLKVNEIAREIISKDVLSGLLDLSGRIEVEDADGYTLFVVPFKQVVSTIN